MELDLDQQLTANEMLQTLVAVLALRDPNTWSHSMQVTRLAMALGKRIGLSSSELKCLHRGALLHDIGKMGVKDSILYKPDKLTPEEYGQMKHHPENGAQILSLALGMKSITPIVLYHHERYDGRGYPEGLAGTDIPLLARIVSLADAYDAMTSNRPYRKAMTEGEALKEVKAELGKQFDPELGQVFIDMLLDEKKRQEHHRKSVPVGL